MSASWKNKEHNQRTCREISDYLDAQKSKGWPGSRSISGRMIENHIKRTV